MQSWDGSSPSTPSAKELSGRHGRGGAAFFQVLQPLMLQKSAGSAGQRPRALQPVYSRREGQISEQRFTFRQLSRCPKASERDGRPQIPKAAGAKPPQKRGKQLSGGQLCLVNAQTAALSHCLRGVGCILADILLPP